MKFRLLGWAGVELRVGKQTVVIDPLDDVRAVFRAAEENGLEITVPDVVPATPDAAVAALLTHLHRDHADAGALVRALASGARVLHPTQEAIANPLSGACAQAQLEIQAAGVPAAAVSEWETVAEGPFEMTAVPASDGLGDEQVSWIVRGGGRTIVHCGDTLSHGRWWRIREAAGPIDVAFLPINAPVVRFPHLRPASSRPVVMDAVEALEACRILGARRAVPIHHSGYDAGAFYRPDAHAFERFRLAAEDVEIASPRLGAWVDV